jgi:hypothetical protein
MLEGMRIQMLPCVRPTARYPFCVRYTAHYPFCVPWTTHNNNRGPKRAYMGELL